MQINTFTLGALAGATSLLVAVPLVAQISNAAPSSTTSSATVQMFSRQPLTQQQVTDMATRDAAFLKNIDALVTVEKTAVQAHEAALTAAASITDDTQRQAAVKKANDDERTAIQNALTANADLKSAMMPFGGPGMMRGGPGKMDDDSALLQKLGMTADQLKAAIAGGQTIQQIAAAKGITLPTPPAGKGRGMHGGWMMKGGFKTSAGASTSATQQ